ASTARRGLPRSSRRAPPPGTHADRPPATSARVPRRSLPHPPPWPAGSRDRLDEPLQILLARPPAARGAETPGRRQVADDHAALVGALRELGGIAVGSPRDECPLSWLANHLEPLGEERMAAVGQLSRALEPPVRQIREGRLQPGERGHGYRARVEARGSGLGLPARFLEIGRRKPEVANRGDAQRFRVT